MNEKLRITIIICSFFAVAVLIWAVFDSIQTPSVETVQPIAFTPGEALEPDFTYLDPESFEALDDSDSKNHVEEVASEEIDETANEAIETSKKPTMKKGPGTISGFVQMFDDTPRPFDTVVTITSVAPEASESEALPIKTTRCDKDGKFWFNKLPMGEFVIRASTNEHTGSATLALLKSKPHAYIQIDMGTAATISGYVIDPDNNPVENAQLFIVNYFTSGFDYTMTKPRSLAGKITTDKEGRFAKSDLQIRYGVAIDYQFLVKAEGFANQLTGLIKAGTEDIRVQLSRGGTLSGRLIRKDTLEPLADTKLVIAGKEILHTVVSQTDADGQFTFQSVPEGQHEIRLDHSSLILDPRSSSVFVREDEEDPSILLEAVSGGQITGRVYDHLTEKGLGKVILLLTTKVDSSKSTSISTDSNGMYHLDGIRPGFYELHIERIKGYPRSARKSVSLGFGEVKSGFDFILNSGITLSGQVTDIENKPIPGVEIRGNGQKNTNDRTQTDQDGKFIVAGFQQGDTVSLRAQKTGYGSSSITTEPLSDSPLTEISIQLTSGSSISGIVVDNSGTLKSHAKIMAVPQGQRSAKIHRANIDGTFTIDGLNEGTYDLRFTESRRSLHPGIGPAAKTVTVKSSEHLEGIVLNYNFEPGLTISGRMSDEQNNPLAGAIYAHGPTSGNNYAVSDNDGVFTIFGLNEGLYTISTQGAKHSKIELRDIPAGTQNLLVVLKKYATISGRVIQARTGQPVSAFTVNSRKMGDKYYSGNYYGTLNIVDPEGNFLLESVEEGDNIIHVNAQGFAPIEVTVPHVTAGGKVENIVISMELGASLSGTVKDRNGIPVPNAMLFLGEVPRNPRPDKAIGFTQSDGSYKLNSLSKGTTDFTVTAKDFSTKTISINLQNLDNYYDFVMTQGGKLEGYATLGNSPLSNQYISLSTEGSSRNNTQTDANGYYYFSGLSDGVYTVGSNINNGNSYSHILTKKVEILDGMTTKADLSFNSGTAAIEGYIDYSKDARITGAYVNIALEGSEEFIRTKVNADGYYKMDNLPAGNFTMNVLSEITSFNVDISLQSNKVVRKDIVFPSP